LDLPAISLFLFTLFLFYQPFHLKGLPGRGQSLDGFFVESTVIYQANGSYMPLKQRVTKILREPNLF